MQVWMTPHRLTASTFSICGYSRSANVTNGWMMPATLTSPSTRPCASRTASGSASTAARSVRSTTWVLSRSVDAVVASSAVPSSPARLRSTAATRPPRASSARTTSRPIPFPPPVTTNTFSEICTGAPSQLTRRDRMSPSRSGYCEGCGAKPASWCTRHRSVAAGGKGFAGGRDAVRRRQPLRRRRCRRARHGGRRPSRARAAGTTTAPARSRRRRRRGRCHATRGWRW